jgi:hypothetical protein
MYTPAIIRLMRRLGLVEDVRYIEWTEVVPSLSEEALIVAEALSMSGMPVVHCFGVPAVVLATEDDAVTLKVTLRAVARDDGPQIYEQGKPAPLLRGPLIRSNEMQAIPYQCECGAISARKGAIYGCTVCEITWLRSTVIGLYSTLAALRSFGESPEMIEAKEAINLREVIIK